MLRSQVRLSTLCLVTIGIFDLVTSLYFLNQGLEEGNPIFAVAARSGSLPFAALKVAFLAFPICLLEFVRRRHPKSAEQGTWIAFAAYVTLYLAHLLSPKAGAGP
jgi:hypothetical protein